MRHSDRFSILAPTSPFADISVVTGMRRLIALVVPEKKSTSNAAAARPVVGPPTRMNAPLAGEGVRCSLIVAQVLEDQSRRRRRAAFLQSELSGAAADRPGSVATACRRPLAVTKVQSAARLTPSASTEHGAVVSAGGEADASELPRGTVEGPPPPHPLSRGTFARRADRPADGLKLGGPGKPSHRDLLRVRCALACRRTDGPGSMRTYGATEDGATDDDSFSSRGTTLAEETDEEDGESAIHCSAEHGCSAEHRVAEWSRRLLAADAEASARDEAGRTPLELVEALWDAKCVHAVLAAHHIKEQEATIASLKAELEQAQAERKMALSCLNLMSVSNCRHLACLDV